MAPRDSRTDGVDILQSATITLADRQTDCPFSENSQLLLSTFNDEIGAVQHVF